METTEQQSIKRSPLPSLGDMIFVIVFLFPLTLLPNYMFADGSVGWHLALGDYVLKNGSAPNADFISYTFAGKPWVAFYWLFDVFMSACNAVAGINGVAVFCAALIATVFLLCYQRMRAEGCDQFLAAILVLIAASASTVHWIARPLLASFLGVYIFATTLEDFHRRRISARRMLITLSITSVIWINAHPATVMGYAILFIYLSIALGAALIAGEKALRDTALYESKWLSIAGLSSLAVTLINPWGFDLWRNIIPSLNMKSALGDSVDEFKSPVFHGAFQISCLEIIFLALGLSLFVRKKGISLPQLLTVLAFGHLALQNVRNIPVFVITALPLIGFLYSELPATWLATRFDNGFTTRLLKRWQDFQANINTVEAMCSMHILPISMVLIFFAAALNHGYLFGNKLLACSFDRTKLPSTTLAYVRDHKLPPERGFNQVNWGGLINYELNIPIFIDDRASMFGDEFYYQYGLAISLEPGWHEYLDKHHIDWIIYPKDTSFVGALKNSGKWTVINEDPVACILKRVGSNIDGPIH